MLEPISWLHVSQICFSDENWEINFSSEIISLRKYVILFVPFSTINVTFLFAATSNFGAL